MNGQGEGFWIWLLYQVFTFIVKITVKTINEPSISRIPDKSDNLQKNDPYLFFGRFIPDSNIKTTEKVLLINSNKYLK